MDPAPTTNLLEVYSEASCVFGRVFDIKLNFTKTGIKPTKQTITRYNIYILVKIMKFIEMIKINE